MFGCSGCYSEDAVAVDHFFRQHRFENIKMLVDDSHLIIRLLTCPKCGQDFVSVFTERIDWVSGDDPQTRTLMPVTTDERALLEQRFDPQLLVDWGRDRRYHIWFSDAAPGWLEGSFHIPPHD